MLPSQHAEDCFISGRALFDFRGIQATSRVLPPTTPPLALVLFMLSSLRIWAHVFYLQTAQLFGCGWYMLATLLRKECEDLYFDGLPEGEFISANGLEYTAGDYIASECPWIYR